MSMAYEEYMRELVRPMREELENGGFKSLTTVEDVEAFIEKKSPAAFVVVNSVCGCAAGIARPAAVHSISGEKAKNIETVTVFAGQDKEATAAMRAYFGDIEPSSPSMAFLKDGEVVAFIHRHEIEGHSPEQVLARIEAGFEEIK